MEKLLKFLLKESTLLLQIILDRLLEEELKASLVIEFDVSPDEVVDPYVVETDQPGYFDSYENY